MEKRVELQALPVIYLIPLSHFTFSFLSLPHFGCQLVSLNCITVSLQATFSPVLSRFRSVIFLLSISIVFSPLPPSFSPHHLSLPSNQDITLPPITTNLFLAQEKNL